MTHLTGCPANRAPAGSCDCSDYVEREKRNRIEFEALLERITAAQYRLQEHLAEPSEVKLTAEDRVCWTAGVRLVGDLHVGVGPDLAYGCQLSTTDDIWSFVRGTGGGSVWRVFLDDADKIHEVQWTDRERLDWLAERNERAGKALTEAVHKFAAELAAPPPWEPRRDRLVDRALVAVALQIGCTVHEKLPGEPCFVWTVAPPPGASRVCADRIARAGR